MRQLVLCVVTVIILCAQVPVPQPSNRPGVGGGTPASPVNSIQFNNSGGFGGSANLATATNADTSKKLRIGCNGVGTSGGMPSDVGTNNLVESFFCSFTDEWAFWDITGNGFNSFYAGSNGTFDSPTAVIAEQPITIETYYLLDSGGNWDYGGERIVQVEPSGPTATSVPTVYWANVNAGTNGFLVGGEFATHANGNFCVSKGHYAYDPTDIFVPCLLDKTVDHSLGPAILELNMGTPGTLAQLNVGPLLVSSIPFASLAATLTVEGMQITCTGCIPTSGVDDTCASGSGNSQAQLLNGVIVCRR